MRRVLALALLLIMVAGCMPIGGELGASTALQNLVPDLNFIPREGDRACLYGLVDGAPVEQIPILSDMTAYDTYERNAQSGDSMELASMEQQGWLQYASGGTSILIVKIKDRQHTGAQVGAEVKILEGSHKGRLVWTQLGNIARLKRAETTE